VVGRVRARRFVNVGVWPVTGAQSRHAHGTVARLVGPYRGIRGVVLPIGRRRRRGVAVGLPAALGRTQPSDARSLPCVRALARRHACPGR